MGSKQVSFDLSKNMVQEITPLKPQAVRRSFRHSGNSTEDKAEALAGTKRKKPPPPVFLDPETSKRTKRTDGSLATSPPVPSPPEPSGPPAPDAFHDRLACSKAKMKEGASIAPPCGPHTFSLESLQLFASEHPELLWHHKKQR